MGFSNKRKEDLSLASEINVTPFIDVMLVLLIIFMVVSPLATVDVPLDLPTSDSKAQTSEAKPIIISLDSALKMYVSDEEILPDQLGQKLQTLTKGNKQQRVFIRADKTVPYEKFMHLINQLGQLGYAKVALVGESNETAVGH